MDVRDRRALRMIAPTAYTGGRTQLIVASLPLGGGTHALDRGATRTTRGSGVWDSNVE